MTSLTNAYITIDLEPVVKLGCEASDRDWETCHWLSCHLGIFSLDIMAHKDIVIVTFFNKLA